MEMGHFIFSIIVIIIVEDDGINKYIWHAINLLPRSPLFIPKLTKHKYDPKLSVVIVKLCKQSRLNARLLVTPNAKVNFLL